VRKGEHGAQVMFWQKKRYATHDENGEEEIRDSLLACVYTVFNIEQCEGVTIPKFRKDPEPLPPPPTITSVYSTLGTSVRHGGDFACYSPGTDVITMPKAEAFSSSDAYSATALHEIGHWTGHTSRLARDLTGRFGTQAYAAEELVAELTSAYLCASLGVDSALEHHASYARRGAHRSPAHGAKRSGRSCSHPRLFGALQFANDAREGHVEGLLHVPGFESTHVSRE
jgi:antirestriction protein ArdC